MAGMKLRSDDGTSMRGYVGRRLCRVGRTVEDADEDAKDGTGAELR